MVGKRKKTPPKKATKSSKNKPKKGDKTEADEPAPEPPPPKPIPSEFLRLTSKIQQLEKQFEQVDQILQTKLQENSDLKLQHANVLDSKAACVRHLKADLEAKVEEGSKVQAQVRKAEAEVRLKKLRADRLMRSVEREIDVERSTFQQQKTEIEDNLSKMEDIRLQRNSQLAHLKRLELQLEQKTMEDEETEHRQDQLRVKTFLDKTDEFDRLVDSICSEFQYVYNLTVKIFAKRQTVDSIRLPQRRDRAAEELLQTQEEYRGLRNQQRMLDAEQESRKLTQAKIAATEKKMDDRLQKLESENAKLQAQTDFDPSTLQTATVHLKHIITQLSHLEDKLDDTLLVAQDQEEHIQLMDQDIQDQENRNAFMKSNFLRAHKILKRRLAGEGDVEGTDWELLQQIRMMFEADDGVFKDDVHY